MVLRQMVERFETKSPYAVMFRAVLENTFAQERIDAIFARHAKRQSQKEILFSTMVEIMGSVASKIQPTVHAAFQQQQEELSYSIRALYKKLQGVETNVSRALVRETAAHLAAIIHKTKGTAPPILPGFTVKILDGNHLAATERRLGVLRGKNVAPLPGQALVVLDPQVGLVQDVILCADAHAQERSLWEQIVECVGAHEVWIADRNFCTANILFGIFDKRAYCIVRHHAQSPACELIGKRVRIVKTGEGTIYEQEILLFHEDGRQKRVRRVTLELSTPTRDGETEVHVLTNLPRSEVTALCIMCAYRQRWTVEKAFLDVAKNMRGEIETLGYPAAALFAFSMALVVFNVYAVLQAATRATHDPTTMGVELSLYYVAVEVSRATTGMEIALDAAYWTRAYASLSAGQLAAELLRIAQLINIMRYRKHPRQPKKEVPKQNKKHRQHTSTARLLDQQ